MQSPINLASAGSTTQPPTFSYSAAIGGALSNWGYRPSFATNNVNGKDVTGNPSFAPDGIKYYLKSWVYTIDRGKWMSIRCWHEHTAHPHSFRASHFRLRKLSSTSCTSTHRKMLPAWYVSSWMSARDSTFFTPILAAGIPALTSSATVAMMKLDMATTLAGVRETWRVTGLIRGVSTPPCSEGLRWWVSGKMITVSQLQMGALLGISEFSSRGEQKIQAHAMSVWKGKEEFLGSLSCLWYFFQCPLVDFFGPWRLRR
jgi:carbonic anhydrase